MRQLVLLMAENCFYVFLAQRSYEQCMNNAATCMDFFGLLKICGTWCTVLERGDLGQKCNEKKARSLLLIANRSSKYTLLQRVQIFKNGNDLYLRKSFFAWYFRKNERVNEFERIFE